MRRGRAWAWGAGWLLAGALAASVGLLFRPHYLLLMAPPLALLAGLALAQEVRRRGARMPALLVAVGWVLLPPLLAHGALLLGGDPVAASRAIYGSNPFPELPLAAARVAELTTPDEPVLVIGSEPQILFLAGRPSATRYIIFQPVLGDLPQAESRQAEVLTDFDSLQPRVVVWVTSRASFSVFGAQQTPLLKTLRGRLDRDYELDWLAAPTSEDGLFGVWTGERARRVWAREGEHLLDSVSLAIHVRRP